MEDDFDLLRAWAAGDRAAADTLMRRHYLSVRRFFDVKVPHEAEDLTQRTLLACVESHTRFSARSSFKAYLFGIARNQLLMHLRRSDRFDRMLDFREAAGPDTAVTPSGVVAMREEQRLLLRALDSLPTDLQIAVMLHYWEGMSSSDVGSVLEVPTSTVTTRLQRAREKIREHVARGPASKVRDSLLVDVDEWTSSLVLPDHPITRR